MGGLAGIIGGIASIILFPPASIPLIGGGIASMAKGSQDPFNLRDLGFLGGALLNLASGNHIKLKPLSISYDQIYQMIEDIQDHEAWVKEIEGNSFRMQLKVLKGGLSE